MFKQKIKSFLTAFINVVKTSPMEGIATIIAVVLGIIRIHHCSFFNDRLLYFPIVFLWINIINYYFKNNKQKFFYFVGSALLMLFMIFNIEVNTTYYIVGLSCTILAYFSHKFYKDNTTFASNAINTIVALALALVVAGITFGIILSIRSTIYYLFNLDFLWDDLKYLTVLIWLGFFPILFLVFNNNWLKLNLKNKFIEILFNYIFTAALIIYTLIFYAYFLKIIIQWELPKGQVAYMVFGFGIGAYILKMLSYLFAKRYFIWLYRKLSYFIFPALLLFWIGTIYRINQYGFTEERIYLFLGGLYLSVTYIILLLEKWGKFLYITFGIIIVLATFTYIPFISAKNLGIDSQEYRFQNALKILGHTQIDSNVTMKKLDTTLQNKKALQTLVSSFSYIYENTKENYRLKKYGISSTYQLKKIITPENYNMILENNEKYDYNNTSDLDYSDKRNINVAKYETLKFVHYYSSISEYRYYNNDTQLLIYGKNDSVIFCANNDSLFQSQLKKISVSFEKLMKNGVEILNTQQKELLFSIETPTQKILIERFSYQINPFTINAIEPYAILLK